MTVNKERVQMLVDALRSGEFEQTQGALNRVNPYVPDEPYEDGIPVGHCCLGVACVVSDISEYKVIGDLGYFDGDSSVLPKTVADWYGFGDCNPLVVVPGEERTHHSCLSELNDDGMDFLEISDLIQKTYL